MITPCRVMIKALEPVAEFAVKVYCNDTQFPYMIADHGVHFDIYRNVDMYFYSIDSVFECPTDQLNRLALVWSKKPAVDMEIDAFLVASSEPGLPSKTGIVRQKLQTAYLVMMTHKKLS